MEVTQKKHRGLTQERSDEDRRKRSGLDTNKSNEGMKCRWSEVGEGQMREGNRKTLERENMEHRMKGKRRRKTRKHLYNTHI